jgi:hypothetical protein
MYSYRISSTVGSLGIPDPTHVLDLQVSYSVLEVCLVKLAIFDWSSRYSTYNKWHVYYNSSHEHEFGLVLKVTVGSSQSVNKWAKHRTEQLAGCGPREDENQSVFMSQVMLPRDSQGSVDFNNFPYRVCSWS